MTDNGEKAAPAVAGVVASLGWARDVMVVRDAVPTVARGHNLVMVTPPAALYAQPALAALAARVRDEGTGPVLLLCPEGAIEEWAAALGPVAALLDVPVQAGRGPARAARLLRSSTLGILITSPEAAASLHARAAMRVEDLGALVLAWPELWQSDELLTPLMTDFSKDAQRLVFTTDGPRVADLVERYARRALTLGLPSAGSSPSPVSGPLRTVSVAWQRRAAAISDLLELLDPTSAVVWALTEESAREVTNALAGRARGVRVATGDGEPAELVIAYDLPAEDQLRGLLAEGPVVLLVPPLAEGYVSRIAAGRRPIRLSPVMDDLIAATAARRADVARHLESGTPERGLLVLASLFERYDAAAVAAAVYELWTAGQVAGGETSLLEGRAGVSAPAVRERPQGASSGTAKVWVDFGKRDGATPADLVAALTKELHVARESIGRIELKDGFSLVEAPAGDAERIAGALSGLTIRRKRISARLDRGSAARGGSGSGAGRFSKGRHGHSSRGGRSERPGPPPE